MPLILWVHFEGNRGTVGAVPSLCINGQQDFKFAVGVGG
ncbi:MAG: hypothetical protein CFH36_01261 [Alphaproteobacteria bacterium MarineAlpha9_Bin6]|nr:MAG: hypothetical protein CFH36_01261 [Alphaproteobacteria bacterium MarineAlpha9_Bin6]